MNHAHANHNRSEPVAGHRTEATGRGMVRRARRARFNLGSISQAEAVRNTRRVPGTPIIRRGDSVGPAGNRQFVGAIIAPTTIRDSRRSDVDSTIRRWDPLHSAGNRRIMGSVGASQAVARSTRIPHTTTVRRRDSVCATSTRHILGSISATEAVARGGRVSNAKAIHCRSAGSHSGHRRNVDSVIPKSVRVGCSAGSVRVDRDKKARDCCNNRRATCGRSSHRRHSIFCHRADNSLYRRHPFNDIP